jgi:hypothetical protein
LFNSVGSKRLLIIPPVQLLATSIGDHTSNQIDHPVLYCTLKSRGQVFELCCLEETVKLPYHNVLKLNTRYFVPEPLFRAVVFGDDAGNRSAHCTQVLASKVGPPGVLILLVLIFPAIP